MIIQLSAKILFFIILAQNVWAQRDILENYEVFEVNGKVQISATVKTGYSCLGMNFLRTEDTSVLFQVVGSIPGICGSNYEPVRYDFFDENPPKNKTVYYRVEMGGVGLSDIKSIKIIDTGAAAYLVSPNPANNQSTIYFNNETKTQHHLKLINRVGLTLLTLESNDNFFNLPLENTAPGIYHFIVTEEGALRPKFSGKISVY
jgi:hypothetical protein